MARTFLTPINLTKLELQNAAIHNLATPPGSPSVGQIYYDTSTTPKQLKIWDGSAWATVGNSQEEIEDFINGLLVAGTGISKTYNDAGNSLTITNTGVTSLAGTTSNVLVNGGTTAATGAVTLSLPATISTNLSGNATTASTLQTARTITLTGGASGSASFNGGSDISIPVVINSSSTVSSISSGNSNITTSGSVGAVTITLASNLAGVNAASATYAVTAGVANSVAADSVPLGTATTGNYVASVSGTDGVTITGTGEGAAVTIANSDKGSSQNIFKNFTDGTNTAAADSNNDTFTLTAGSGIGIVVNATTDTATFTNSGVTSVSFGTTGLTPSTGTTGDVTVAGTLAAANGGTGQSSYTIGDLLYASASTTVSKLADVATGNVLISGGVGAAPSYGKVGLTTHVTGTLGVGNGGTGTASTPTNGQLLIGNGTNYTLGTISQGTGITVTNGSGTISIANAGVTSILGTTNQVTVSASVGGVTLSLPQNINTTAEPTFAGATLGNIRTGITSDNEIDTSTGNLTIDSAGGTVTVDDNLTVTGNLTVSGSVTYINTQTLEVSDNLIILNNDVTGTPTENAGVEIERGTSANVSVLWNETDDRWTITNDGTNFYPVARKYNATLSTSSTAYVVNHALNSQDVVVNVYTNAAPYDTVEVDVERTDANNVTLRFAVAPTANAYKVVVVG